jgi:hypothetical protein
VPESRVGSPLHVTQDAIEASRKLRVDRQQILDEFRAARHCLMNELHKSISELSQDHETS